MPEGDEDLPSWAQGGGEELPSWAEGGEVVDGPPRPRALDAVPEGYRETGRRELVLPMTSMTARPDALLGSESDAGAAERTRVDPYRANEVREIEKDPAHLAARQATPASAVVTADVPDATPAVRPPDRRTTSQRIASYLRGRDPHALDSIADAFVESDPVVARMRRGESAGQPRTPGAPPPRSEPASIGGVELPSLASARRAVTAGLEGDAYDASATSQALQALFPTAPRPEGMSESAPDLRSQAGLRNALSGFGWADELAPSAGWLTGETAGDEAQGQMRRLREQASEQAPGSAVLGSTAESIPLLAIPGGQSTALGRIGTMTGVGLGLGTVRGAGESDAALSDNPGSVLEDAVIGGALEGGGALLGGAAAEGVPLLQRLGGWAARRAAPAVTEMAAADRMRAMGMNPDPSPRGPLGRALQRAGGRQAYVDRMAERGIGGRVPAPGAAARDAGRMGEEAFEAMDDVTRRMDEAAASTPQTYREPGAGPGPGRVDLRGYVREMEALEAQLRNSRSGLHQRAADRLRADIIEPVLGDLDNGLTFREAHELRQRLDELAGAWALDPNVRSIAGMAQQARRSLSGTMDDAAEAVDPALRAQWRRANQAAQDFYIFRDNARETSSNLPGAIAEGGALLDTVMSGSPTAAASALAARSAGRFLSQRGPGIRAVGLEGIAARLRSFGERFGPNAERWARALEAAQRRGGTALAVTHALLQRRYPEYRAAVEEAQQSDNGVRGE